MSSFFYGVLCGAVASLILQIAAYHMWRSWMLWMLGNRGICISAARTPKAFRAAIPIEDETLVAVSASTVTGAVRQCLQKLDQLQNEANAPTAGSAL